MARATKKNIVSEVEIAPVSEVADVTSAVESVVISETNKETDMITEVTPVSSESDNTSASDLCQSDVAPVVESEVAPAVESEVAPAPKELSSFTLANKFSFAIAFEHIEAEELYNKAGKLVMTTPARDTYTCNISDSSTLIGTIEAESKEVFTLKFSSWLKEALNLASDNCIVKNYVTRNVNTVYLLDTPYTFDSEQEAVSFEGLCAFQQRRLILAEIDIKTGLKLDATQHSPVGSKRAKSATTAVASDSATAKKRENSEFATWQDALNALAETPDKGLNQAWWHANKRLATTAFDDLSVTQQAAVIFKASKGTLRAIDANNATVKSYVK